VQLRSSADRQRCTRPRAATTSRLQSSKMYVTTFQLVGR
jgi:hypothetical protein